MEARRIHFFMLGLYETWGFKAAEREQNDCSSSETTFEGFRVEKELFSIKKTLD